jgi:CDP-4-dehydro-6-deoxyglucose reductase, E1
MVIDWKEAILREWQQRSRNLQPACLFPLMAHAFDAHEIVAAVDTLLSGQLTMSNTVCGFEKRFAEFVGSKYAVMVNSGSSANLLAMAVAANPKRSKRLHAGDEVLVPAVCWSTSVWPIIQMGLKPVFVDVDPATLNADPVHLRKCLTARTRGIFVVHVLGNSAPLAEIQQLVKEYDLILIEDTCESLGSKFAGRYLGSMSEFGTFSFYYSHHLTTGEGGMVVCNDPADYDLLLCLRAHGWSRLLSNHKTIERENPDVDPRFLFVNVGYNLRPMEVQAAFGLCQLEKLTSMNTYRCDNKVRLTSSLTAHPRWKNQFTFPVSAKDCEPAWFGFPCLLHADLERHHRKYMDYLSVNGVENRPIVSGNFVRQPALKLFGIETDPQNFPGAEAVNRRGFFIGLHTEKLADSMIERLTNLLLSYDFDQ